MLPGPRDRPALLPVIVLAAALTVAACASSQRSNVMQSASGFGEEEVQITIQNNDFRDATIYAYWNGVKDRIGMVTGKTTDSFETQWRSEEVQLEVDFVGGGGFYSDRMPVYQGDHLDFVILPQF